MKKNVGLIDKRIRYALAAVLAAVALLISWPGAVVAGLLTVAAIPVLTSLVSTCPLYLPFGISTRRIAEKFTKL